MVKQHGSPVSFLGHFGDLFQRRRCYPPGNESISHRKGTPENHGFKSYFSRRPWKSNMEHTNHPFRKEHYLPQPYEYVPCSSSRVCKGNANFSHGDVILWLVVSTHLKNISQNRNLPQIGVTIKNI